MTAFMNVVSMKEVNNTHSRKHFLQITSAGLSYWLVGGFALSASQLLQSCNKDSMMQGHDSGMMMGSPVLVTQGDFTTLLPQSQLYNSSQELRPQNTTCMINGQSIHVLGYFALSMLGPSFNFQQGDVISIPIVNDLLETTNIHWHGLHIASNADGLPNDGITAGASFIVSFQINQRASMCWYHPHIDGLTASQVWRGLAGMFFIRDQEEASLNLPSGEFEIPLVIQDRNLSSSVLNYAPSGMDKMFGLQGSHILINGVFSPYKEVSKSAYRLRVLNGSNSRIYNLAFDDNRSFLVIGNDGGLLPDSTYMNSFLLAPGERVDLIVDFSTSLLNSEIHLVSKTFSGAGNTQGAQEFQILKFIVSSDIEANNAVTSTTSNIDNLVFTGGLTRTFDISNQSMNMSMRHNINGIEYSPEVVNFSVQSGIVEKWVFDNSNGAESHPIHVHGTSFQIAERTSGRNSVMPFEMGWKDTVLILPGEVVSVLIQFSISNQKYVLHCHNLEHEDNGMMLQFEVL